jgi:hypothetical protein
MTRCVGCGTDLEGVRSMSVEGIGDQCCPCHNRWAAKRMGVPFDTTEVEPVTLSDTQGMSHTFEVHSFLCPTGREMTAVEVTEDGTEGYEFKVLGDFGAETFALLGQLCSLIRERLAQPSLERGESGWRPTRSNRIVARVTCDREDPEVPLLVVDGRPFSWDEVGRMLASYEGFELEIRIRDSIRVVGGPLLGEEEP